MSIPVRVEAWQTDTPDMPGSWRRTATAVTSMQDGTQQLTRCPILEVEPHTSHLRVVWKKNGESAWYVWRPQPLGPGQVWPSLLFTQDAVDKGIPYVEDRGERQVLMRVPLPKKPLLQSTPSVTYSSDTVAERMRQLEAGVLAATLDGDVRRTTLELLTGFRVSVGPSLAELDERLRQMNNTLQAPLPTFEGVDEQGRAHFRFRSTSSTLDLYIGKERKVEMLCRMDLQLPEKVTLTPQTFVNAAFVGPIGEA